MESVPRSQEGFVTLKSTMDKGLQNTCPSETRGRIQYREQTSSLLKDEEKDRAFQSISHFSNFDVLDALLNKLNEEKNDVSYNQGIEHLVPSENNLFYPQTLGSVNLTKDQRKKSEREDQKKNNEATDKNFPEEYDFQGSDVEVSSEMVTCDSQVKDASEKGMKRKSHDNDTSRKSKVMIQDFSQPKNPEYGEVQITNHFLNPVATQRYLLTQRPEEKIKWYQNQVIEEHLPHSSSHPEILPSPQTYLYYEQQEKSKVKEKRKKKKKKENANLLKRYQEESFQMKVQHLLEMVKTMENMVQNMINKIRRFQP